MSRLTIHINRITHTVELRLDREISFDKNAAGKPINVGGRWGKITNDGMLCDYLKYNPNRWKGVDSFKSVLAEMEYRKSINE